MVRPCAWLAFLAPLFYLSYGFANWVTGLRGSVPSVVFGWESHIPFLAWTIVPYWSTNLLYAASLFVCRDRRELDTHGQRLLTVQILSVAGFLLFPLRFTFDRPETHGLFGAMFDALTSFDKPFNQAPSLHLCITAILWVKYSAHLNRVPLRLMQAWLVLTGLSTLTTYQHHFIDIPAGILAGLIAIGLFPDDIRVRRASRLAAAYAFGALILSAAAFRMQGLGWVLLWPAAALSVVSLAYWTERPALFGKSDRGMRPLALVVLAPYVAGAWLNSRFWTRGRPCAGEIEPGVWIGRAPRRGERDRLGIRSVVDVGAELPVNRSGIDYRAVPMLDLVAPSGSQLRAAAYAISGFETARPTLVCCALGYSRSAAAGAAWLVVSGRADTADAAAGRIRTCRPDTLLTQDHCRSLAQFASAPR